MKKALFVFVMVAVILLLTTATALVEDTEVSILNMGMSASSSTSEKVSDKKDNLQEVVVAYQDGAIYCLPETGRMFLTFDDGYSGIKRILDSLRKEKVVCTFFVMGSRILANPDLWRQAVKDGHEIAYHSMNHDSLLSKSDKWIREDIKEWEKTARDILGVDYIIPKVARFPGGNGHKSARILKIFNDEGYVVIGWSDDTLSGVKSREPDAIASFVLRNSKAGDIMLQHFDSEDSSSVRLYLKTLKERAERKGFLLGGKLSDALKEAGYWKER